MDTITAIATPSGRAGVGIIRLSGADAETIARELCRTTKSFAARYAQHLSFFDADGAVLDSGLLLHFPAPASYTGEDVIELQAHGSPVLLCALLERVITLGARLAEPGEFTRRAVENGKLHLEQAEAVAACIDAATLRAARQAQRHLQGEFGRQISAWMDELTGLLAHVEACLDFPEEEIPDLLFEQLRAGLEDVLLEPIDKALATSGFGERLFQGATVAIIGAPNVGKSTLLNLLSGRDRAIISPQPGTTRDVLEVDFELHGIPVRLIDTAGLRRRGKVFEAIEKFSVVKTLQAIESAHVVLLLIDATQGVTDQDAHIAGYILENGRAVVLAINKWDAVDDYQRELVKRSIETRLGFLKFANLHLISAQKRQGLGPLWASIAQAYRAANCKMSTPVLTRLLLESVQFQSPKRAGMFRPKMRYAHQGGMNPPVIVIHGNSLEHVTDAYKRYLEGRFRREFDLVGTPLRIEMKTSVNPYTQNADA